MTQANAIVVRIRADAAEEFEREPPSVFGGDIIFERG
jgi:hypothetical protein